AAHAPRRVLWSGAGAWENSDGFAMGDGPDSLTIGPNLSYGTYPTPRVSDGSPNDRVRCLHIERTRFRAPCLIPFVADFLSEPELMTGHLYIAEKYDPCGSSGTYHKEGC